MFDATKTIRIFTDDRICPLTKRSLVDESYPIELGNVYSFAIASVCVIVVAAVVTFIVIIQL